MIARAKQPDGAPTPRRPILILGLGNILLRDEGVGVRVVEAMRLRELPPDVELCDGGTAGLDLLEVIADRRKVVVIDAIDGPAKPGTVVRLRPVDLAPRDARGVSLHEVGLLEALSAAEQLHVAPEEVVIIGVKPMEVDWGLTLSPDIARRVPEVVELVLANLNDCGRSDPGDPSRDREGAADQNRDC